MAMFVSKYLNLENELDEKGIFDSILDEDSNYFINVKLLKKCVVPEFVHSYEKVQGFDYGCITYCCIYFSLNLQHNVLSFLQINKKYRLPIIKVSGTLRTCLSIFRAVLSLQSGINNTISSFMLIYR